MQHNMNVSKAQLPIHQGLHHQYLSVLVLPTSLDLIDLCLYFDLEMWSEMTADPLSPVEKEAPVLLGRTNPVASRQPSAFRTHISFRWPSMLERFT
jgi:hypothetical protein